MSRVIVFVIIVVLGMFATVAISQQYTESGEDIVVENESFNATAEGPLITLDDSNLERAFYDNTTRVFDGNDTELEQDVDYLWNENNGTLEVVTGGPLENEDEATITYSYDRTTEAQESLVEDTAILTNVLAGVVFLGAFIFLLRILTGGGL